MASIEALATEMRSTAKAASDDAWSFSRIVIAHEKGRSRDMRHILSASPANVLALLTRIAELEGEVTRIKDDVDIHRTARAKNFDLYQAAIDSCDALENQVKTLTAAMQRLSDLTPEKANALDARALHLSVKAIAETALASLTSQSAEPANA